MSQEVIESIAKQLATHYEGQGCGNCACLGLQCYNPSDYRWWLNFLELFSKEDVERMVEEYINLYGYPQI